MILFEDAYNMVMNNSPTLGFEQIEMTSSVGRVLAEDVISDMAIPPFDKSAMDGYACCMGDIHQDLEVIEVIPAGKKPQNLIGKNQCAKIMTGAMIPEGADCVIMVEYTEQISANKIRFKLEKTSPNICFKAEDIKEGQVVMQQGNLIRPQHVAVMASVGCTFPKVYKLPKVGIITTGEELVEPHQKPGVSEIRNSNGYQLIAQLKDINIIPEYYGIVGDTEEAAIGTITKAFDENDVVILTGGVSMGDFDMVPDLLKKLKVHIHFQKIAVQPGKPTTFGTKNHKLCFGLPGNPVSSFIQFELLVKPAIYKMMGHEYKSFDLRMQIGKDIRRKKADRISWIPISLDMEGKVFRVDYHGSAHINSLTSAFGIMAIPIGTFELKKEEWIHVRPL
ncbi:molybdopterin molybdotransferase MoeA [candidate division KSB1 bacterium]